MIDQPIRAFVLDLEALTRKHGLRIGGCGCCGSPFIEDVALPAPPEAGYQIDDGTCLKWIDPRDEYVRQIELDDVVRPA